MSGFREILQIDLNSIYYCWEALMIAGISLLLGGVIGFLFGIISREGKIEVADRDDLLHPKGR